MSKISVAEATEKQLEKWDSFVDSSINGTLFHKRAFLGYHGDRFAGLEKFIVILKGETVIGQFCYAIKHNDSGFLTAMSPYGASYGGIVLSSLPQYSEAKRIITNIIEYLAGQNINLIRFVQPIACCSPYSLDVLTYVMLESGFVSIYRDISNVFNLKASIEKQVLSRARNSVKKAKNRELKIIHNAKLEDLWVPMEKTYKRHGVPPTHNLEQLKNLQARLPDAIWADVAYKDYLPVGGVCYFKINSYVLSSFYFCQTPEGREDQSLSFLIMEGLHQAKNMKFCWLDFGTSSVEMHSRGNVFKFKEQFSREGMFREVLQWEQG